MPLVLAQPTPPTLPKPTPLLFLLNFRTSGHFVFGVGNCVSAQFSRFGRNLEMEP